MNIMMTKKEKSCSIKPTVWLMNVCLLWHPQRAPRRAVKKETQLKRTKWVIKWAPYSGEEEYMTSTFGSMYMGD